jgi:phosphatidylglycerophosphate synthase
MPQSPRHQASDLAVRPVDMQGVPASPRLRVGLLFSLVAANVLFALLAATTGLTVAGWAIGFAYALATAAFVSRGITAAGGLTVGPANAVTLARSTLVAGTAALVTTAVQRPAATTTIVVLAAMALGLDGCDGWVARRTRSASAFGTRFDGEVDAFLILVLSVQVARALAWWVVAIGLMRYVFSLAGVAWPWLRGALPARRWRKVVAGVQGIVLTVAVAGVLPRSWALAASVAALLLLSESFGRDVGWLFTHRTEITTPAPNPRLRNVTVAAITVLAFLLFWVALVGPERQSEFTVTTLLRVPLEGVAIVAAALILPPRLRSAMAIAVGLLLGVLTVMRVVDFGFFVSLDRPFNPVTDLPLLKLSVGVLSDSVGRTTARDAAILAVAAVPLVVVAVTAATVRVTRVAARHRDIAARVLAGLTAIWIICLALGVTTGSGLPVDSVSTARLTLEEVRLVNNGLHDRSVFNAQLAASDPYGAEPASRLLTGLRGKDVLVVFVESYGQVAVQGTRFSPPVDAELRQETTALQAAGFSARSAFLRSPTFGGASWLAHSTLQSGLWVDNEQRYGQLEGSSRFTLTEAFKRAGWRTVFDIPSSPSPWLQGQRLYHFDAMYGTNNVGYRGPRFSYARIPDQYTLEALYQRELQPNRRKPVMAEIDLDSSHLPWAPLPSMVPWQQLGDGAIYRPMASERPGPTVVWRSDSSVQAAYGQSIQYSLTALASFIRRIHDNKLVIVMLGDHQPATTVSGDTADHDVPITIIAHDPKVIDRLNPWRWEPGMLPSPRAPVWPMDAFRDRFLAAYGESPGQTVSAPTSSGG